MINYQVASYELRMSPQKNFSRLWLLMTSIEGSIYLDVNDVTNSIPISGRERTKIIQLRLLMQKYEKNHITINDLIYNVKKLKNDSKFLNHA